MTLSEKASYLKGLMEGMKLDTETNEGKMIAAMVDLLNDMAVSVGDLEDTTIAISDELDEIEDDLDSIEDYLMDDEDDDDDDYDYEDEDEDEDDEELDDDAVIYEVECGKCGEIINFDDEVLDKGSIKCPNCGEVLEFSSEDVEDE